MAIHGARHITDDGHSCESSELCTPLPFFMIMTSSHAVVWRHGAAAAVGSAIAAPLMPDPTGVTPPEVVVGNGPQEVNLLHVRISYRSNDAP